MSFSFFDLFIIIIFSQGLFLLIAIQLMPNKNRAANRSLSFVLITANIMLIGRILVQHIESKIFLRLGGIVDFMIFLIGPFLYEYIRRLTFKEPKIYRLNWKHFIPAIIYLIYFSWNLLANNMVLKDFYDSGKIWIVYFFIELIGIVSIIFYIIKSYRLSFLFKKNEALKISYNQQISKYIISLLVALSCFVLLWIFSFVNGYFFRVYFQLVNYNAMWVSSSLLMYFIGFYSLTQPDIFRIPIVNVHNSENNKERLKLAEVEIIKQLIETSMRKEKIYLISDLSLSFFAEKIKTTPNNLSWVLNKVYQKNFYEFINEYRVKDFIERIKNNQHKQLTIFSVALESGFNTKSTFNKAFKTITKETPSSFIKKTEMS